MVDWNNIVPQYINTDVEDGEDPEKCAHLTMHMLSLDSAIISAVLDEIGDNLSEDDFTSKEAAVAIMKAIAARARMDSEWMA